MSDIFISYKREEQSAARKLADALEKRGWSVWWDPKLRAGDRFDDAIEEAIKDAKSVIVMWSKLSVQSRYVRDEATYALKLNKLAPVKIEEVDLPFRFEGIQTGQLINWDGSANFPGFQKLIEDLSTILGEPVIEAKEAGRAAEGEHKIKIEEERKRKEEEQKKAEEERKQKENEAKHKADEKKRRKEREELRQQSEEDRKRREAEGARRRTEKNKLIDVASTRRLVLPILLTSIGWTIGRTIGGAIGMTIGMTIDWTIGRTIGGAIGGAIGGLATVLALRQIVPGIQLKQVFIVTIGWTIGGNLGLFIGWTIGRPIGRTIGMEMAIAIGGVMERVYGNAIAGVIGEAMAGTIGGAIAGAIGGGVMFLLLARAKNSN